MKLLALVLSLSCFAASAQAAKCQVGGSDHLNGDASGIRGGSDIVHLAHGTPVHFLGVPGGMHPNYEVIAVLNDSIVMVGSSTQFNECNHSSCESGMVATLTNHTSGIRNGHQLVNLERGTRVMIHTVPHGMNVNYEIVPLDPSESILLGGSTKFQNCN